MNTGILSYPERGSLDIKKSFQTRYSLFQVVYYIGELFFSVGNTGINDTVAAVRGNACLYVMPTSDFSGLPTWWSDG